MARRDVLVGAHHRADREDLRHAQSLPGGGRAIMQHIMIIIIIIMIIIVIIIIIMIIFIIIIIINKYMIMITITIITIIKIIIIIISVISIICNNSKIVIEIIIMIKSCALGAALGVLMTARLLLVSLQSLPNRRLHVVAFAYKPSYRMGQ